MIKGTIMLSINSTPLTPYLQTLENSLAARIPTETEMAEASQTAGRISKGAAHPAPARTAATVVGMSWMEAVLHTTSMHRPSEATPGVFLLDVYKRQGRLSPLRKRKTLFFQQQRLGKRPFSDFRCMQIRQIKAPRLFLQVF